MTEFIQVAYSHNKIYNQTMNKLPNGWQQNRTLKNAK